MPAFSTLSASLGIEVKARGGMSVRTVMKMTAADGTQTSGGEAQVREYIGNRYCRVGECNMY